MEKTNLKTLNIVRQDPYLKKIATETLIFLYNTNSCSNLMDKKIEIYNELKNRYFNEKEHDFNIFECIYNFHPSYDDIIKNIHIDLLYVSFIEKKELCHKHVDECVSLFFDLVESRKHSIDIELEHPQYRWSEEEINKFNKLLSENIMQTITEWTVSKPKLNKKILNYVNFILKNTKTTVPVIKEEPKTITLSLEKPLNRYEEQEFADVLKNIFLYSTNEQNEIFKYVFESLDRDEIMSSIHFPTLFSYTKNKTNGSFNAVLLDLFKKNIDSPQNLEFNSQEELYLSMKEYYLSFENATEQGWDSAYSILFPSHKDNFLLEILNHLLNQLKVYPLNNFKDWQQEIAISEYYLNDIHAPSFFYCSAIVHEQSFVMKTVTLFDILRTIFDICERYDIINADLFCFGKENSIFQAKNPVYKKYCAEVSHIFNNILLKQEDFDYCCNNTSKNNFLKYIHLCLSNNKNSDNQQVTELFFIKKNMIFLLSLPKYRTSKSINFSEYFYLKRAYLTGLNKLSFENLDDIRTAFMPLFNEHDLDDTINPTKLTKKTKTDCTIYKILIKKLSKENKELFNFVANYIGTPIQEEYCKGEDHHKVYSFIRNHLFLRNEK